MSRFMSHLLMKKSQPVRNPRGRIPALLLFLARGQRRRYRSLGRVFHYREMAKAERRGAQQREPAKS
jgi:hypothetical protein